MGLDATVRAKHKETGLYIELDNYNGRSAFGFLQDFMEARHAYGEYVEVDETVANYLLEKGLESIKKSGYSPDDLAESNWGVIGFLKLISLRSFYDKLGYALEVECDW